MMGFRCILFILGLSTPKTVTPTIIHGCVELLNFTVFDVTILDKTGC